MQAHTSRRALALVGMPGAGKTLCAKHLEARGFFQFRFGGIVVDEVQRRGLDINPANERAIREELREQEGMEAIAERAIPHLQRAFETHLNIVIDGLYGFGEYKLLRRALDAELIVLAIVCSRQKRYARLGSRPERPLTNAEAEERDFREIDHLEKGGPIAIADYTLLNEGTSGELIAALDDLLARLNFTP